MTVLGGVADDLTGATTTGVLLARSGARTAVCFDESNAREAAAQKQYQAVMISTGSRAFSPEDAYRKVSSAAGVLIDMGVRFFHKRIDTTLRGPIGSEIDAMLDMLSGTVAVVVPAMPSSRRILAGGYSIIDGIPLVRTPAANDVRTPVRECYVPRLLSAQTKRKTAWISLSTVLGGSDCILREVQKSAAEGAEIFIVDAVEERDLEEIAKACIASGKEILSVDPGAFTVALARQRGLIREELPNLPGTEPEVPGKTVLVVAGSATPVTKRQMEVLEEAGKCYRIPVDPHSLMDGGSRAEREVAKAADLVQSSLESDCAPREILLETALHSEVLDLDAEDASRGYAHGRGAELINEGLGQIAEQVMACSSESIAGIYATGGDTLVSVCRHLGSGTLSVLDYVIPQADVSQLTGKYAGLPVVGKGGLTGDGETAVKIVDRLFMEYGRRHEAEEAGAKRLVEKE